ncbi:MAG: ferrochelatase [Actinomycetaceae bacterium]|nr:ferrochelatase [Actinomycetaceae bacterium]
MTESLKVSEKVTAVSEYPDPALVNAATSPTIQRDRPALLLVNLGTPEAPTPPAIRTFLREFLSDRRVIEMNPIAWKLVLECFILPFRPRAICEQYERIWTPEGSPLAHGTYMQGRKLQKLLGADVEVRIAMRYGQPSIESVLSDLYEAGHRRVLVLPAYPQYTASTVGSIYDEVARWTLTHRDQMEIRTIRSFEECSTYIEALAAPIEEHWRRNGRPDFEAGERLITSYHSIPMAMHEAGDPYKEECERTSALLAARLNIPSGGLIVTYQSVFGRAEWIGPATIDTVEELGKMGTTRVDVICPGFMADCLETLEEIDELNRETFTEAGGGDFHYIKWANDSVGCVNSLAHQARIHLSGWVDLGQE